MPSLGNSLSPSLANALSLVLVGFGMGIVAVLAPICMASRAALRDLPRIRATVDEA